MKRFISLSLILLILQVQQGFCGFTFNADGFAVKRLVEYNNGVMATDGKTFFLVNQQGEKLGASQATLDNTYLLQSAVYSNGVFYMLYQHNDGALRFALLAMNEDLSVRWLRDYEQVSSTFGYAMVAAEDGGVVVAGRSCISGFFVCGIDENGEVIWNNTYAAGDPTAIPGALTKSINGYTLAYKWVSGDAWHLGVMSLDLFGYVNGSTDTEIENNFYIKGITNTDNGFSVLIQQPDVSTNSIVTFNQALQAQHRFDITSTKALQLTGLAFSNGLYYVSGNALQTGTPNLDLMYGNIDINNLTGEAISVATAAYDDARDVKAIGGKIWIGGSLAGNAHIASFADFANKPCSFETLSIEVVEHLVASQNFTSGFAYGVDIDAISLSCATSNVTIHVNNQCNINESTTAVEATDANESDIELYPNPSNGSFYVTFHQVDATEIIVYDAIGRIVLRQHVSDESVALNLTNIASGTYALVAKNNMFEITHSKRFVISR